MSPSSSHPANLSSPGLDPEKDVDGSTRAPSMQSLAVNEKKAEDTDGATIDAGDEAERAELDKETKGEAVAAEPVVEEDEYPTGARLTMVVIALVLSIFLVALDMTIVATAIPKITDEFGGLELVAWYSSAFFMCVAGFQSTWGKVYKYFPLKASFIIGIIIFELGSLICAVAPTAEALIVGRAIAGVGAAGIGSGAYTLIAFSAPPAKRPMFTGITGASYGIASVVGPLIGGAFTANVTWRWCFYINLPIGGIGAVIIFFFFTTPASARPIEATLREKFLQTDLIGAALIMAAVVCYVLALQYGGQTDPWDSSRPIGLLVGFGLLVITFAIWEWWQGERSMLVPRLIRKRSVWLGSAVMFFFAGAYFVIVYYLPIYFQSIDNVNATMSGVRNLPLIIAVTIATVFSGGIITATGISTPFFVAGAVLASIGSGLLYTLDIGTSQSRWIGFQVLAGFGYGLSFQIPIIVGQANAAPEDLSSITAIILFFQIIGGAFFVSAAQSAFVNRIVANLANDAPGVSAQKLIGTGAAELRSVFSEDQMPGILLAYMSGLKAAFIVCVAACCVATVMTPLASWKRLNPEALKAGGAA